MGNALDDRSEDRVRALQMARRYFQQQAELGFDHLCASPSARLSLSSPQQKIEQLYLDIKNCTRCSLHRSRTHFVFGEGNPQADVVFIGEAPGREEDLQGRPFVGQAGQLLTKMLSAIKFCREEVFIGNILKCRPPQNRDPLPEEVELCEPHLRAQLAIVRPRLICALGRIAAQTLLRTSAPLSALRGRVHQYHGMGLIATYHPAALLRNQGLKRRAWEDLQFLRREHDQVA